MSELQTQNIYNFDLSLYLPYNEELEYLDELKTDIKKLNYKIEILDLTSNQLRSLKDLERKNQVIINKCLVQKKQDFFYTVWIKNKYSYWTSTKAVMKTLNRFKIKKAHIRINYGYSLRTDNKGVLENE